MKNKFIPVLTGLCAVLALTGCGKTDLDHDGDKAAASTNSPDADNSGGVKIDQETQERIGLKIATPVAAQWRPQIQVVGSVVDTRALAADAADYQAARMQAQASQNDLERTEKLAEQGNASTRALETARAAAAHDVMALKSLGAKFTGNWGQKLENDTNLVAGVESMGTTGTMLVKITLPAGMATPNPVGKATIRLLSDESISIPATFSDDLGIDPTSQQETLLFTMEKPMAPCAAVTAMLETGGDPVSGVEVPGEAVLRHMGKGWVYEPVSTNQFQRVEVPLDRPTANGWFVTDGLTTTNQIVVTGAQTILSAELSSTMPAGD